MTAADVRDTDRWVPVATAPGGDPGRSLQPVYDVLEAAEIPVGFDPYRPGDASSPYPSPHRAFRVVVPEHERERALEVIREAGIAIPGESSHGMDWHNEPATKRDWSDHVLDEDVETDRILRRRRRLIGWGVALLVIVLGLAYLQSSLSMLGLFD